MLKFGWFWGSGSLKVINIRMTSYLTLIETMRLFCTVFELSLISQKLKTSHDHDSDSL